MHEQPKRVQNFDGKMLPVKLSQEDIHQLKRCPAAKEWMVHGGCGLPPAAKYAWGTS